MSKHPRSSLVIGERVCLAGMFPGEDCPRCGAEGSLYEIRDAGPERIPVVACDQDNCGFHCYADKALPAVIARVVDETLAAKNGKPRRGGRPTKYTDETVEAILNGIAEGMTYESAAAYAGVSIGTFQDWKANRVEFSEGIKAAEAAGKKSLLRIIRSAATYGAWQAAAWLLERRYPEEYGRQKLEVTGDAGGPLIVQIGSRNDGPQ